MLCSSLSGARKSLSKSQSLCLFICGVCKVIDNLLRLSVRVFSSVGHLSRRCVRSSAWLVLQSGQGRSGFNMC